MSTENSKIPYRFSQMTADLQLLVLTVAAELAAVGGELDDLSYYAYLEYDAAMQHLQEDEEPTDEDIKAANESIDQHATELNTYRDGIRAAFVNRHGIYKALQLIPFIDHVLMNWTNGYSDMYLKLLDFMDRQRDELKRYDNA